MSENETCEQCGEAHGTACPCMYADSGGTVCDLCGLTEGFLASDILALAENFGSIAEFTTDEDIRHHALRAVAHLAHVRELYENIRDLNECGQ